jgi:hypothetical protein
MKKQLLILLLGMVVIGAGATGAWFYLTTAHEDDKPAASLPAVTRRIAYELEVTNTGGSPIQEERLMVRAPASTGRGQTCTTIQAGLPYELSRDEAGNQVLLFDLSIPPYGVKIIPFEAEVSWRPPAASGGGATATDYTHAEKYIELNHPALQAQAASLRRETTAATVTATFSWVSTQIDKTSSAIPPGAPPMPCVRSAVTVPSSCTCLFPCAESTGSRPAPSAAMWRPATCALPPTIFTNGPRCITTAAGTWLTLITAFWTRTRRAI